MPSIEGGGVEKNLFLVTNFLVKKIKKITLITISKKFKKKFHKSVEFITLSSNIWDTYGRKFKYFLALILLIKEILKDKPDRVKELLKDEMTHRPRLPEQEPFVKYLKSQTNAKKLSEVSGIDYTTVEHWFRFTKYFSYPSKEHWNIIKTHFNEIKYDEELNYEENKEWK